MDFNDLKGKVKKPVIYQNDYQITFHDITDDAIDEMVIRTSLVEAIDVAKERLRTDEQVKSYRVMRCLINSKYARGGGCG